MTVFNTLSSNLAHADMHCLLSKESDSNETIVSNRNKIKTLIPEITDQKSISSVNQFRQILKSRVYDHHSDYDLLRFLKARNFNIDDAVLMYTEMIDIRKRFGLDKPDFLQSHKPMEAFINHYPFGLFGCDKEGCPIAYDFPGRVDVKGFALAMSDEEFSRQVMWNLEALLLLMQQKSLTEGRLVDKWTVIVDVRDLSVDHFSKAYIAKIAKVQRLFDVCYPERVNKLLVVNLSPLFDIGYKLFKPFIPEATRQKLVVMKNMRDLLNFVDADQLPVSFGGTRVDSFGDPECKEWITLGSKVDQKLYKYNRILNDNSMLRVKVPSSEHHEYDITAKRDDVVSYKICSDSKNLRFGVFTRSSDKKRDRSWIRGKKTIGVERQLVEGSFQVSEDNVYVLFFDNKFFSSANVSYFVEVTSCSEIASELSS